MNEDNRTTYNNEINMPIIEPSFTNYNGGYDEPVVGVRKSKSVAAEVVSDSLLSVFETLTKNYTPDKNSSLGGK